MTHLTRDLVVPAAHGAWLQEQRPGAQGRTPEGHGHITEHRQEILDWLLG